MHSITIIFVLAFTSSAAYNGGGDYQCYYDNVQMCLADDGWCYKSMAQAYPPVRSCCVALNNYVGMCCIKMRIDDPRCSPWLQRSGIVALNATEVGRPSL